MIKTGMVLSFLLLGRVSCYIDGRELQSVCKNMEIQHFFGSAGSVNRPFTITSDRHRVKIGDNVTVVLNSTIDIYGFMMDGRMEDGSFGGKFVRLDQPDFNILLDCEGNPKTTMTHKDNRSKRRISGTWQATKDGEVCFDAAVVGDEFWRRSFLPTPPPATTSLSTTSNPTTRSTSTAAPTTALPSLTTTSNPTPQATSSSTTPPPAATTSLSTTSLSTTRSTSTAAPTTATTSLSSTSNTTMQPNTSASTPEATTSLSSTSNTTMQPSTSAATPEATTNLSSTCNTTMQLITAHYCASTAAAACLLSTIVVAMITLGLKVKKEKLFSELQDRACNYWNSPSCEQACSQQATPQFIPQPNLQLQEVYSQQAASHIRPQHQKHHLKLTQQTPKFNPQHQQQWTLHTKDFVFTKDANSYGVNPTQNTSTSSQDPSPYQYISGGMPLRAKTTGAEQMTSRRDIMWVLKNLAALQIFTVGIAFDYQTFKCGFSWLEYMMIGFTVWAFLFCLICVVLTHIERTELNFRNSRTLSPHSMCPIQSSSENLFLGSCHTLTNVCFTLLIVGFYLSQNHGCQCLDTATPAADTTGCQEPCYLSQIATAILLVSHFLHLEGSLFLLGWKMDLIRHLEYKLLSILSLCTAIAAFILFLLCNKYDITVRAVGVAVALSLIQTITACCLCGPSHELRKIMIWVLRILAILQAAFTVVGVFQTFEYCACKWLHNVLIGFIVWTFMFCGICVVSKNIVWTSHRSRKRVSPPWCFSWIVNRKVSLISMICHFLISLAVTIPFFVVTFLKF